ncbi:MAG: DUF4145 domain-containing protein [Saprospiraceae bacterium]|nr:DUF4145 domain-containing protein [Lewinellaceae bacterium]MBP6811011.1 DUF4145 domain-containing protein [Saprospiraceae bacterium]
MIIRKGYFNFNNIPRFSCPNCGTGQLRFEKDSLMSRLPAWIRKFPVSSNNYDEHHQKNIDQIDIFENNRGESIASFFLQCDHHYCKEAVIASGLLKNETETEYDNSEGEIWENDVANFYPTSFYPTVHLFELPKKIPEKVRVELINSFSLFWISPPACGNAIRVAVERLMDERNIPISSKGKETALTLHQRIEKFGEEYKELSELLLAIKWIGNDASHTSDLYHSDVVLAYEFFERCLIELFEESKIERLKNSASEINLQRKPISKIQKAKVQNQ